MGETKNYIFPASTGLSSFRDAGYKDTSMAVAELIDNSIQAKATKIRVIAFEEIVQSKASKQRSVNKVAVFDNGEGMAKNILELCLGFAQGTRLDKREGIGRFGVGLPLASISQCKRVTVYSWQGGKTPLKTHLDIEEVITKKQNYTNEAIPEELPPEFQEVVGDLIGNSGSLVIWENLSLIHI